MHVCTFLGITFLLRNKFHSCLICLTFFECGPSHGTGISFWLRSARCYWYATRLTPLSWRLPTTIAHGERSLFHFDLADVHEFLYGILRKNIVTCQVKHSPIEYTSINMWMYNPLSRGSKRCAWNGTGFNKLWQLKYADDQGSSRN